MKYQAVIFDYRGTLGFKEIPEFVQILVRDLYNSGYLLGIISNSDRYGDARWVRNKLVHYEISEYFQCVVGSAVLESGEMWVSGGVHKPDPRIFTRFLNLLGLEPHEAVYVGDSFKHDVCGAGAIGMATMYVGDYNISGENEDPYTFTAKTDNVSYASELWNLLEDSAGTLRPNRITGFSSNGTDSFCCTLRHLTEPLVVGQPVIIGKHEYIVQSFTPHHTKDEIIHAKSDVLVTMKVTPVDWKELNNFTGLDLSD